MSENGLAVASRAIMSAFLVCVLVALAGCPYAVTVPVLVPLSGDLSDDGLEARAAVALAAEDINAAGNSPAISLDIRDTRTDPREALAALMDLNAAGAPRIVLGPASSGEAANLQLYADREQIVLLSPTSTSPELAIAGDTLYRLWPDDTQQAKALAALLAERNIEFAAIVYRRDSYGYGFADALQHAILDFADVSRIPYASDGLDADAVATSLYGALNTIAARIPLERIAVVAFAFEEIAAIVDAVSTIGDFPAVAWFGADGWTLTQSLASDPDAAAFLVSVNATGTFPRLPDIENAAWRDRVVETLSERLGTVPGDEALLWYDAVWVAAQTYSKLSRRDDTAAFRQYLEETLDTFSGVSGDMRVNAAGDRVQATYRYWQVQSSDDGPVWVQIGTWEGAEE